MLALVCLPAVTSAQSGSAMISGRIADPSGQPVPGTQVRLTNIGTAGDVSTASNLEGIYVFGDVRPGPYRMTVEKAGFRTIMLEDLTLEAQDVLGRNFTLEISPVVDTITVAAGRDEQNLSPAVSTIVSRQFVENMPLNGRSFQSLIQLTPGTLVAPAGQGREGQFVVNGQRPNTNYFTVDGVSVNFGTNVSKDLGQNLGASLPALTIGGGMNSFVSVDAMQEFRTQTSAYVAEFGRTPGAQIAIVTKSGTNQFHGTAFDYVRNEALDARNWFNPPPEPKPPLRQHDFGGTLGGPLRRDRSFFFFSYEGLRLRQPHTDTGYFFTPEARAAVAPVYRPIVNALPIPTGPVQDPTCDNVSNPCVASLTAVYSDPTQFDAFSLRADHRANDRVTVFARVAYTPSVSSTPFFSQHEAEKLNTALATGAVTMTVTPTLLNDLRMNWGRATGNVELSLDGFGGAVPPPASALFPPGTGPASNLATFGLSVNGVVTMGTRAANRTRQINIIDTLSWAHRAHLFKFGVDYRQDQPMNQPTNGFFLFVTGFDQLRKGTMGIVVSQTSEAITASVSNWSLFAQDTWRASDRLTLTYGVRWEMATPPVSITAGKPLYAVQGIFDSNPYQLAPAGTPLWQTRSGNFAPRAGAVYQLTPRTILRGGGGTYYDLGYGTLLGNTIFGFPYNQTATTNVAGQPFDFSNPVFTRTPISTSLSSFTGGNLSAFDPHLQLPMTIQWNAAVERQLGATETVSLTYLGSDGRRLLRADFIAPPGSRALRLPVPTVTQNAGRSRYDALQVQYQHRFSRRLQALASYTYAHARDTEPDDAGDNFSGLAFDANTAPTIAELPVPPLSPSDFDVRHAFSAAVTYELPSPGSDSAWAGVAKGWAVDALVRASSSPPLNVRIEGVSPVLGAYTTQPDLVPGQPTWIDAPGEPGGRVLNPNAFTLPPTGRVGDLPRNSIPGPFGINQTDVAIRRSFATGAGTSLEFRAEFFNVFNHPMFAEPSTLWGLCTARPCTGQQSDGFGKVPAGATLNVGLGGGGLNGGQSAIYAVGGPRSGQLSLKLRF